MIELSWVLCICNELIDSHSSRLTLLCNGITLIGQQRSCEDIVGGGSSSGSRAEAGRRKTTAWGRRSVSVLRIFRALYLPWCAHFDETSAKLNEVDKDTLQYG
jgi:hypothetical protein